jgi:hypothetical protein
MFDGTAFDEWLKKGLGRNPSLYGGQVKHPMDGDIKAPGNTATVAKKSVQCPLGKQMMEERKSWDRKQATSDHDDGDYLESRGKGEAPGIPVDWDGKED